MFLYGLLLASVLTFTPQTGAIRNPGQGWSAAGGASRFSELDAVVNVGAGYHRYQWNWLEPEEGVYDWSIIEKDIAFFASKGLPFAFRIMCANYHSDGRECTPQWVFDKGAKSFVYLGVPYMTIDGKQNRDHITPVFDDPIFIDCHRRFIKALAARYDGDPRLVGIDIGSFGNWGEWHCWELWPKGSGAKQMQKISPEVRRLYVDMYKDNFHKTPLQFLSGDAEMLKYAAGESGYSVGLRRDGVGDINLKWCGDVEYACFPKMTDVWKHCPIWFEWWAKCTDFGRPGSWQEKWTIPRPIDWMLENHVSLVNTTPFDPVRCKLELPEIYPLLKKIDLKAGARLVAHTATVSQTGDAIEVRIVGVNEGVARVYLPYVAEYRLVSRSGKELFRIDSSFNPCAILPGPFEHFECIVLPKTDVKELNMYLRLYHRHNVLADFRWAVVEADNQGALPLGTVRIME